MADNQPADTAVAAPDVRTAPKPKRARPRRKKLPPFKVILHNDEHNTMDHVVLAIVRITPLNPRQAIRRMLEAHFRGKALLLSTHKERGELYVQQFASMSITTTLESDS